MESSELSLLKQFIIKNGTMKSFKKKEPFITEGNKSTYVGFVKSGLFRYVKLDNRGTEHIIGFAFQNEYIADCVSRQNRPKQNTIPIYAKFRHCLQ